MALLLAKGEHLEDWRGVDEFVADYRDAVIRLAAATHPEAMAGTLSAIRDDLGELAERNRLFARKNQQILDFLHTLPDQQGLRGVLADFYHHAYEHFRGFASVPAFFAAANGFLSVLTALLVASLRRQFASPLPSMTLLALGPAGRLETTRFCRVQLVLVWEGAGSAAEDRAMAELAAGLVTWLKDCGVVLEEAVTPVHPVWRGTLDQWERRLEGGINRARPAEMITLLRLVDQAVLVDEAGLADRFRALCARQLHRRPAVENLVERCTALSNGLGLMGGFRLTKGDSHPGTFDLLGHALLPLAASVAGLCLLHDLVEDGTPRRVRELVRNGRLAIDLAERALQAWQLFCSFRLTLELQATVGQDCRDILHLDPDNLSHQQQQQLRAALETVADLQHLLQASFGQTA